MSEDRDPGERPAPPPVPTVERWLAVPTDAWAWLLGPIRAALHAIDDVDVTPSIRRLRSAPAGKLAGGRVRRELATVLAAGGPVWRELHERIAGADQAPEEVGRLVRGEEVASPVAATSPRTRPRDDDAAEALRARLREVKRERDDLRRQLQGAQGRIAAVERQLAEESAARADDQDRLLDQERALAERDGERDRAVERERRRRDAEIARLEDRITELRRAEQRRHETRRAAEEGRRAADLAAQQAAAVRRREEEEARAPTRLVPGRPSQLPRGVQAGTTEATELLLHPGRALLVDGYNVTKRRHPDWDLEQQRTWLVQQLGTLAIRRRVRPVAVFDGQRGGRQRPVAGVREVEVRFTPAGVTADDELVLAAEATDEPLVVVTDDRELIDRLRPARVDVVGTQEFLWALR